MASIAACRSSSCSPADCRRCVQAGDWDTMHRRNSALFVILATALLASVGIAQDTTPVFTTDTRLVILPVTVLDKNGHLMTNLTQGQFEVFENDAPQPLKLF